MMRGSWVACCAALYCGGAHAVEVGNFDFSFNAFGTAGVVHSSDDQADFVSNAAQPSGAGFTHTWSVTPDSKLGGQVTATFLERLSAVVQVISEYRTNRSYSPTVDWANLKFQITPDADIRAGRIALPTFMNSDTLNVGYALPDVRIPLEIYGQLPIDTSDGADGSYRFHWDETTLTVHGFVGRSDSSIPGGYYSGRNLRGVSTTLEDDALTVHLAYQSMSYGLVNSGIWVVSHDPQSLLSLGAGYDPGKWYIAGEGFRNADDGLGLYYGAYVIGGYRIGKFTPYVGYARVNRAETGYVELPPYMDQRTNTLGLRWDFVRHFDLKLQLDHTVRHGGFNVYLVNQQPGFEARGTTDIVTLALDFVW